MSIEPNVLNPATETVEILGDRWITGIMTACMFGVRRFGDFQRELQITPSVLSAKLSRVVGLGVLQRQLLPGTKSRFEYRLTDKGRAIFPVFTILLHWAECTMGDVDNPRVRIEHGEDHHRFIPVLTCSACGNHLERTTTRFRADA